MNLPLPAIAAVVVAAASAVLHGQQVDRWGISSGLATAAVKVEDLQVEFDGWQSEAGEKLQGRTRELAGAEGDFSRSYRNERLGASVQVMLLVGRPGPIALHSPDYCFVLAGMKQITGGDAFTFGGANEGSNRATDTFRMADYRPPERRPGPDIRTFWAWSADGRNWATPDDPRFAYADEDYLYRIYFTAPAALIDEEAQRGDGVRNDGRIDPTIAFMERFLDRLERILPEDATTDGGAGI